MGAAVEIDAKLDYAALRAAVGRLALFSDDRQRPMLDAVGGYLVSSTVRRFHNQCAPSGNPWKPSRRAVKTGGETLIETAMLIRSLTYNRLAMGVEWGSPVKYAAVHQNGATFTVYPRSQRVYRRYESGKNYRELKPGFVRKSKANFVQWATIANPYVVKIPARPYLGIDAADAGEINAIAAHHVNAALLGNRP